MHVRPAVRRRQLLVLAAAMLLSACQNWPPGVFVLHSPAQPANADNVTFTAQGRDSDGGIARIEIWERRYLLDVCNGMQCASFVSSALLETCDFSPPQANATCAFTTTAGYPDSSYVAYQARATDSEGSSATEGWIYFAAGEWPWPDNPIPIYGRGAPGEKIDLVFIPDTDYNGDNDRFMDDVTDLLSDAYFSTDVFANEIRPFRGYWNFYITYRTGDAQGFGSGCNSAPSNWTNMRSIVNSGGIVHTAALRDCAGVGDGSLFSVEVGEAFTNPTAIHETGHSVFSLSDEYCCDGGYWQTNPHPNVMTSQANCQNTATANGWATTDCVQIGTTGFWRLDPADDLMRQNNSTTNPMARSDQKRIYWLYFDNCADTPGC